MEVLISKLEWRRNELRDRALLIQAAHEMCSATHFVALDYDEVLAAPCWSTLRNELFGLPDGVALRIPWVLPWRGLSVHRVATPLSSGDFLSRKVVVAYSDAYGTLPSPQWCILRGDQTLKAPSLHCQRQPKGMVQEPTKNKSCFAIEFRFINLLNVFVKSLWYKCLGAVSGAGNATQGKMFQKLKLPLHTLPVPPHLINDSSILKFAHSFNTTEPWRFMQILKWTEEYGAALLSKVPELKCINFAALKKLLLNDTKVSQLPLLECPSPGLLEAFKLAGDAPEV